ncbi:MAG: nitric oxide reductase transcription regulator [Cellvibrio sp. 79]|nr:MAG: nitric oxide reductase transcription regulator [Cellvibrio sp. 79]
MAEVNSTLLIDVALDLANSIGDKDRFDRLLTSICKAINCDALALLALNGEWLVPLAIKGLAPEVLGRRFRISDHPRLAAICSSHLPLRFAADSPFPDPYDGLVASQPGDLPVHACMGLPLYSDNQLIGVVTLDSLTTGVFDPIPESTLEVIAAISAASLKTAMQLNRLEQSAKHQQDLVQELTREALSREGGELIGQSVAMQALITDINLVANSDYSVLIQGETGVGKDLVARKLHQLSHRSDGPLVHINCASLPETLAESELFGHTKGAFTGADSARAGKFQLADGGTLFLDEVGELPLAVQSKLLRALQSGEIQPVGRDRIETVNVRVLAATNRNLKQEVEQGNFRADLYHRLSVYPIWVPPLRERARDVLLLAGYFLEVTARKLGLRQLKLAPASEAALLAYNWPGNVRELEHMISRAALKAKAQSPHGSQGILALSPLHLDLVDIPAQPAQLTETAAPEPIPVDQSLKDATEKLQKQLIIQALESSAGNWTQAAKILDLDRANLARLAKRLGVKLEKKLSKE